MSKDIKKWLEDRAKIGTGTQAKQILDYINDLESEIELLKLKNDKQNLKISNKASRCLALADSDRPTIFNYGSGT